MIGTKPQHGYLEALYQYCGENRLTNYIKVHAIVTKWEDIDHS